jgi:hypothetical protein
MMECLAENGEDPNALIVQVARLQEHMLKRIREVAAALRQRTRRGLHRYLNQAPHDPDLSLFLCLDI